MKWKLRDESGSVTVEATISLSAFMFAIVTVLTFVNICIVQSKISTAINGAAKELSHYSYLYSLTGIHDGKTKLVDAAAEYEGQIDGVLTDVNAVFTEIQNIGQTNKRAPEDVSGMLSDLEESGKNIADSGGALKEKLEALAEDPKGVAMGLVKIAATDGWDYATSRLIAAPLAKGLCKKNLVNERGGDVEAYLKHLGVVPDSRGSYLGGLDFSNSYLFPGKSNEIRISVTYDVDVIALLPIDFSFTFTQTAVTHGWLSGHDSYRTTANMLSNSNVWTEGSISERVELMRHQGLMDYGKEGYAQVTGGSYSDIHAYNSEKNEFLAIHSMNPLYSAPGEDTLTLDDISETAIKEQIEHLCTGINDTANGLNTIKTKTTGSDGTVTKAEYNCQGSTQKIVLVIPEDEGLREKMEAIINTCNTKGVEIELVTSYGNGARTTTSNS